MMKEIFRTEHFLYPRKVRWSPDDSTILFSTYDNNLYIYDKEINFIREIKCPKMLTDIVWYPLMNTDNKNSCAFLTVCSHYPIQLIDSNDGHIRSSYYVYVRGSSNICYVSSLGFSGPNILAGTQKGVFSCEITRPDRKGRLIYSCTGSIDSILPSREVSCIVCGTSTGTVHFFDDRTYNEISHVDLINHRIDSLCWFDGKLIVSGKLEDCVFVFDIRNLSFPVSMIETERKSSKVISLSSNTSFLTVGSDSAQAKIYNKTFDKIGEIGDGNTNICEINSVSDVITVSGGFECKNGDEEVSYKPRTRLLCLNKIIM